MAGQAAALPPALHATYASWINHVERWFSIISQRAIRRGSFRNVRELRERIERFIALYNQQAAPFKWTATAEAILAKVTRISKLISGTAHSTDSDTGRMTVSNAHAFLEELLPALAASGFMFARSQSRPQ